MPDLATELSHLALADKHIADAQRVLAEETLRSEGAVQNGGAPSELLQTIQDTLAAFEAHRALIVQTISDIRAGKL